jgi:hypothetical protein
VIDTRIALFFLKHFHEAIFRFIFDRHDVFGSPLHKLRALAFSHSICTFILLNNGKAKYSGDKAE